MDPQAIWLTVRLATTVTIILLALATPLAWWIAKHPHRSSARSIQAICRAPPRPSRRPSSASTSWSRLGPLTASAGRALIHLLGHPLAFTFGGLVFGSTSSSACPSRSLPLIAGFQSIGPEYVEAASAPRRQPCYARSSTSPSHSPAPRLLIRRGPGLPPYRSANSESFSCSAATSPAQPKPSP